MKYEGIVKQEGMEEREQRNPQVTPVKLGTKILHI